MPRNPKIDFNMTQIYFGRPHVIDLEDAVGSITIYSPTIGEIVDIGDDVFFKTLNVFITNTTQYRLGLWDMGLDWNVISDFDLFVSLYRHTDQRVTKMLFGDLDFQKFEIMMKEKPNIEDVEDSEPKSEVVLYNKEDEVEINKNVHNHISQYLRNVFGIFPEEKITKSEALKQMYISKDRKEQSNEEWKKAHDKDDSGSVLQSSISSLVNHPGFKYNLKQLQDVGVAEFYDSLRRVMVYEQSTALMKGMYSGFVDGSKIKQEDYNFMRDLYKK